METLISVPLSLGRDRTLHIQQKQKSSGLFGTLQSLASGWRSGTIHVQHVPAGAPAVLDVCSDQHASSPDVQSGATDKAQTVVITTASAEPVQIYLRWPRGTKEVGLAQLTLQASDYTIKFDLDVPSVPPGRAHLSLADVDFVPARELVVVSGSGGVSGLLPMEDVLDVSTSSGSVSIALLPLYSKGAHDTKLSIKSNSGTLSINTKLDAARSRVHLPSRDCAVALQTSSGSIRSVLGLTRSTIIKSNSGSHHLTALLTDHSRDRRSDFATSTNSGSQNITVVAPPDEDKIGAEKAEETGFVCKHKSNSGSVRVAYPGVWEGTVEAHSNSGSITVTGDGVKTDRSRNRVTGVKGTPVHHTDVGTSSGSISVKLGDE